MMKRRLKKESNDLVVRVPHSFWPRFFSLPMAVKFFESTIAFCPTPAWQFVEKFSRKNVLLEAIQVVFFYPEKGEHGYFEPSDELFKLFGVSEKGESLSPIDLPFPFGHLRNISGVKIYELLRGKRRIFCLVPTWDEEKYIKRASAMLNISSSPQNLFDNQELVDEDATYLVLTSVPVGAKQHNITLISDSLSTKSIKRPEKREDHGAKSKRNLSN